VAFGIKEDLLREICTNMLSINFPLVVAEGVSPKDGVDAYLLSEVRNEENEKREKFNFRNVLKIPSVKSGQLLASIIPPTPGTDGTDVSG
uniref:flagellar assembly protein A n=1 Tax=Serratia marcescens TaxID=615 RepID=UPI000E2A1D8C